MKYITIAIDRKKALEVLAKHTQYFGSTEWKLYVNEDGEVDVRNNTHYTGKHFLLMSLYGLEEWTDGKGRLSLIHI